MCQIIPDFRVFSNGREGVSIYNRRVQRISEYGLMIWQEIRMPLGKAWSMPEVTEILICGRAIRVVWSLVDGIVSETLLCAWVQRDWPDARYLALRRNLGGRDQPLWALSSICTALVHSPTTLIPTNAGSGRRSSEWNENYAATMALRFALAPQIPSWQRTWQMSDPSESVFRESHTQIADISPWLQSFVHPSHFADSPVFLLLTQLP
jgi:hypothetical protein